MTARTVCFENLCTIFNVTNAADVIQRTHANGSFYELHQLVGQRYLIPLNCTVIDCGANVGNHTIFYARHTLANRVYPFEANSDACGLLRDNIAANPKSRAQIDTSYLGIAVGARRGKVKVIADVPDNLGAKRFGTDDMGDVECVPLDALMFEGRIGLIKIDVEGMEMAVLAGAARLLQNHRPAVAIEVDQANEVEFWTWVRMHRYVPVGAFFDYLHVRNYLLIPTA